MEEYGGQAFSIIRLGLEFALGTNIKSGRINNWFPKGHPIDLAPLAGIHMYLAVLLGLTVGLLSVLVHKLLLYTKGASKVLCPLVKLRAHCKWYLGDLTLRDGVAPMIRTK